MNEEDPELEEAQKKAASGTKVPETISPTITPSSPPGQSAEATTEQNIQGSSTASTTAPLPSSSPSSITTSTPTATSATPKKGSSPKKVSTPASAEENPFAAFLAAENSSAPRSLPSSASLPSKPATIFPKKQKSFALTEAHYRFVTAILAGVVTALAFFGKVVAPVDICDLLGVPLHFFIFVTLQVAIFGGQYIMEQSTKQSTEMTKSDDTLPNLLRTMSGGQINIESAQIEKMLSYSSRGLSFLSALKTVTNDFCVFAFTLVITATILQELGPAQQADVAAQMADDTLADF